MIWKAASNNSLIEPTPMPKPRHDAKLVKSATWMTVELYVGRHTALSLRFPGKVFPLSVVFALAYPTVRLISWRWPDTPDRITNESVVWRAVHYKTSSESFFEAIQLEGSTYMVTHGIYEQENGDLEWKKLVPLDSIALK